MTKLFLGNEFNDVFESNFSITEDEVCETYNNPDLVQELKIGVKLSIKKLNKEGHRSNLLLCVQDKGDYSLFIFSYWIPEEAVISFAEPLSILQNFVATFGCRIRVGCTEDFFITEATVALKHSLKHPDQVIQVLGSEHVPCQYYFFHNNEFIVSDTLVFLDVYYAFSVNNNKYTSWLYKLTEVGVKVPKEWYNRLSDLVEVLEPNGKTQLKILRPKHNLSIHETSEKEKLEDFIEISVPEKYRHQFNYISNVLTSLKPNEKIVIVPSFSAPKCLFCDSKNVSKEHIFPKWLKPFLDKKIFNSTIYLNDSYDESASYDEKLLSLFQSGVEGHKENSHGYTTQTVCRQCNNTWMSNIENKAKAILAADDERLISSLAHINKDDANILSRWLLKISLLLADKITYYRVFSVNEYKNIKAGYIPNGVIVEVAYSESYSLNFVANHGANLLVQIGAKKISIDKAKKLAESYFVTSIQIGKLLFRVSYLPPSSLLLRKASLKRTETLYPWKVDLPFHELDTGEEIWSGSVSDGLELHVFNFSMILVDR